MHCFERGISGSNSTASDSERDCLGSSFSLFRYLEGHNIESELSVPNTTYSVTNEIMLKL
jgi:hypothetical protein